MSANISTYQSQPTIAYFGEVPWHGLGNVIPLEARQNIPEVMRLAGLDWDVEKLPLYHAYSSALGNQIVKNPYAYGVIRPSDGQILSSVGPDTELVNNADAFTICEPLVKEYGFTIEVAGALGQGQEVWMACKAPNTFEPVPGDVHDIYFMLRHFHTNGGSTEGTLVDVRPVCANTIGMAIGRIGGENVETGRAFRIKKTSGVKARIAEARELMKHFAATVQATKESYQKLFECKLTPEQVAKFIEGTFELPKTQKKDEQGNIVRDDLGQAIMVDKESEVITARRKKVTEMIFTQPGAELAGANVTTGEMNAWSVICAITHYFDHVRAEEAKSDSAKRTARVSAAFGGNNATKLLALARMRKLQQSLVVAG